MKHSAHLLLACLTLALAGCQSPPPTQTSQEPVQISQTSQIAEPIHIVADDLQIPWDIAFLPDGDLLVTERPGTLLRIGANEARIPIEGVLHRGEGGLLGIALHPNFTENQQLYLYLTTQTSSGIANRIDRYRLEENRLTDRTEILTVIPGSSNHDGGRIEFGPDGMLYVTTGDASQSNWAQDRNSLAGKILRLRDDGSIPSDNPFGTAVYSYGHRNPQGLTWDASGQLWATEHGRSGIQSGYDELNKIEAGKNYGWPTIEGPETRDGMQLPALHSGANDTWAPASAAYHNGSIFFGGLRGEALYEAILPTSADASPVLNTYLQGTYGRIRTVRVGPDGFLYVTTSNTDGRGNARVGDDKILKIDPNSLQ